MTMTSRRPGSSSATSTRMSTSGRDRIDHIGHRLTP
jgi:hypothetical protein